MVRLLLLDGKWLFEQSDDVDRRIILMHAELREERENYAAGRGASGIEKKRSIQEAKNNDSS